MFMHGQQISLTSYSTDKSGNLITLTKNDDGTIKVEKTYDIDANGTAGFSGHLIQNFKLSDIDAQVDSLNQQITSLQNNISNLNAFKTDAQAL